MSVRLCKDCRWYGVTHEVASCLNEAVVGTEPVHGGPEWVGCGTARSLLYAACGPEGKAFEPKPPQPTVRERWAAFWRGFGNPFGASR